MLMYNYKYFASFAALAFASTASCLSVTPSNDAHALAKALLGEGLTLVSATFSGAAASSGLYTKGPLGIRDSIVLTTGDAVDVIPGPGTKDEISKSNGGSGNSMCEALNGGVVSFDTAFLSMDVILQPGFTGFSSEFIFSTEEYPEWVGSDFNDVFGIYIDGKQVAYDTDGKSVDVSGPSFTPSSVLTPPASGSSMDGSTPILWSGHTAAPGPHKIDIFICDTGDRLMDSALFVAIDACVGECKKEVAVDDCSDGVDSPPNTAEAAGIAGIGGIAGIAGIAGAAGTAGTVVDVGAILNKVTDVRHADSTITAAPTSSTEAPCVTYTSYIIKTITKCDSDSCHPTTTFVPTVVTSTLQLTVYTPCSTLTVSRCAGGPDSPCVTYTNTVTYPAITTYPAVPTFTAPAGYPTYTGPVSAGIVPTPIALSSVPYGNSTHGNGTHGCAGGAYCGRPIPSAGTSIPVGPSNNLTSNATCPGGPNCPRSSTMLSFTSATATPSALVYASAASHIAGMTSAVVLGFIVAAVVAAGI